jgi:NTE family protein
MSALSPPEGLPAAGPLVICLAGSGFRAAAFHLGAIRRLNELGMLATTQVMHAVAGGSLVQGMLAAHWESLDEDDHGRIITLDDTILEPIRRFVRRKLRLHAALASRVRPQNWTKLLLDQFTPTDRLVEIVDRRLLGRAMLADLVRTGVQFHWHATNLRTGGRWDFSAEQMGETLLGHRPPGRTSLAEAVVASMVDPTEFPPLVIRSRQDQMIGGDHEPITNKLRKSAQLTDGSLQDPLAIDTAIGSPGTLVVCDGGSMIFPTPGYSDWVGERMIRSLAIQRQRSVEVRRRWLVEAIRSGRVAGTYIGLAAHHADYGLPDSIGYSTRTADRLWKMPAGMNPLNSEEVELLSNHGYTIADAAVKRLLPEQIRVAAPLRIPHAAGDMEQASFTHPLPSPPGQAAA